jgi:hypothetical protein
VPQRDPVTNAPILDAAGHRIPQTDPAQLNNARIVYEYVRVLVNGDQSRIILNRERRGYG